LPGAFEAVLPLTVLLLTVLLLTVLPFGVLPFAALPFAVPFGAVVRALADFVLLEDLPGFFAFFFLLAMGMRCFPWKVRVRRAPR
jgi:hypothetical protein